MCGNKSESVTRSNQEDSRILAEAGANVVRANRDASVTITNNTIDAGTVKAATEITSKAIDFAGAASGDAVEAVATFAGDALTSVGESLGLILDKNRSESTQIISEAITPLFLLIGVVVVAVLFRGRT